MAVIKVRGYLQHPSVIENGEFYVTTPFDYFLYKVNKDTAIKTAQFVFPANRVLSKKILESTDVRFLDSVAKSLERSKTLIKHVENIFYVGNKLLFKLKTPSYTISSDQNEYQYNFIYDTVLQKVISLDRITSDSICHLLPMMSEMSKWKGLIPFKGNLYSYISSLALFATRDANKDKKPAYSAQLQRYFNTESRKSNPVIVRMKFKE